MSTVLGKKEGETDRHRRTQRRMMGGKKGERERQKEIEREEFIDNQSIN